MMAAEWQAAPSSRGRRHLRLLRARSSGGSVFLEAQDPGGRFIMYSIEEVEAS